MLTLGVRCLLVLGVGLWTATASAQTKMTIATGVDPVFSAYYVAQQEGLFKKHGLDVRINTGPSGSAMVAFLVNGQIESAFGSEIAGVANHNLDPNVVVVAQATRLVRWIAVVGRNIETLDQLKGKKVGVARGSGGEVFWLAMIDKLKSTSVQTWFADFVRALAEVRRALPVPARGLSPVPFAHAERSMAQTS